MTNLETLKIEIVKCFAKNPPFFDEIATKYADTFIWIGRSLTRHSAWIGLSENHKEVAEFLDGHNFIVKYPKAGNTPDIVLIPQYGGPND